MKIIMGSHLTNAAKLSSDWGPPLSERKSLMRVAASVAGLPEVTSNDVTTLMKEVVNSRSDKVVREMMERIQQEEDPVQETMWGLVREFGLIDARRNLSIIEARLETINKLHSFIEGGAKEVPEIHNIVKSDPWLLDPRWHLLDDEVDIKKLGIKYEWKMDPGTGRYLDFVFALQPSPPARIDEVVVVEIKRGTNPNGSLRRVTEGELQKFQSYVAAAKAYYAKSTDTPRERGLLIAQAYTQAATQIRQQLEQIGDPKLEFKTWDRVITETERMHSGWLKVSKRRADQDIDA